MKTKKIVNGQVSISEMQYAEKALYAAGIRKGQRVDLYSAEGLETEIDGVHTFVEAAGHLNRLIDKYGSNPEDMQPVWDFEARNWSDGFQLSFHVPEAEDVLIRPASSVKGEDLEGVSIADLGYVVNDKGQREIHDLLINQSYVENVLNASNLQFGKSYSHDKFGNQIVVFTIVSDSLLGDKAARELAEAIENGVSISEFIEEMFKSYIKFNGDQPFDQLNGEDIEILKAKRSC